MSTTNKSTISSTRDLCLKSFCRDIQFLLHLMALSRNRECAYHGASNLMLNKLVEPIEAYYGIDKVFRSDWEKERLAESLFNTPLVVHYPPLQEMLNWIWENFWLLTREPWTKIAFSKIVLLRHKGGSDAMACLQLACTACGRVSRECYWKWNRSSQRDTALLLREFFQPYMNAEWRLDYWTRHFWELEQLQRGLQLQPPVPETPPLHDPDVSDDEVASTAIAVVSANDEKLRYRCWAHDRRSNPNVMPLTEPAPVRNIVRLRPNSSSASSSSSWQHSSASSSSWQHVDWQHSSASTSSWQHVDF